MTDASWTPMELQALENLKQGLKILLKAQNDVIALGALTGDVQEGLVHAVKALSRSILNADPEDGVLFVTEAALEHKLEQSVAVAKAKEQYLELAGADLVETAQQLLRDGDVQDQ